MGIEQCRIGLSRSSPSPVGRSVQQSCRRTAGRFKRMLWDGTALVGRADYAEEDCPAPDHLAHTKLHDSQTHEFGKFNGPEYVKALEEMEEAEAGQAE